MLTDKIVNKVDFAISLAHKRRGSLMLSQRRTSRVLSLMRWYRGHVGI